MRTASEIPTRGLTAERELALGLAGTAERRAERHDELLALLERSDPEALVEELERQRLLVLLGGRAVALAGPAAPAALTEAVRRATAHFGAIGTYLELVTFQVLGALEQRGIAAVPLKGPLAARTLHGDPAMRDSGDIDVLVNVSDLRAAADVILGLGWEPAREPIGPALPLMHHELAHPGGPPPVDLHWRVHYYETEAAARMVGRARLEPPAGRRLQPADELACLLLFYARDGFAGLRFPADVAAWWDRFGAEAPAPVLGDLLAAHPRLDRAWRLAAVLLDDLVGVPAEAIVGGVGRLPHRSRMAKRVADPLLVASEPQRIAEKSLMDGLVAPTAELPRFLRRRLLPPAEVMRRRRPDARSPRLAQAEHAARVLRRFGIAGAKMAAPSSAPAWRPRR